MNTIVNEHIGALLQGSPEWHAHRAKHFNASEAGAVMGVNPWAPRNQVELYDLKTGALEVAYNSAMQHGIDTEPEARVYAERLFQEDFTPCVKVVGRYSASLDGLNFFGDMGIEIKCPVSLDSKLFDLSTPAAVQNKAPHYWWQIVHQFHVCRDMKSLAFVIYHKAKQTVVVIQRQDVQPYIEPLLAAWEAFGAKLDAKDRPIDEAVDETDEFQKLVHAYKLEKLKLEAQEAALKVAEEAIKAYAKNTGKTAIKGFGASVTLVSRQGSIDYTKVPALKDVDLDAYRKKPTSYWMIKL